MYTNNTNSRLTPFGGNNCTRTARSQMWTLSVGIQSHPEAARRGGHEPPQQCQIFRCKPGFYYKSLCTLRFPNGDTSAWEHVLAQLSLTPIHRGPRGTKAAEGRGRLSEPGPGFERSLTRNVAERIRRRGGARRVLTLLLLLPFPSAAGR